MLLAIARHEQRRGGLAAVAGIAGALQGAARDQLRHHGRGHEGERGIEHGHVDEVALAAALLRSSAAMMAKAAVWPVERIHHRETRRASAGHRARRPGSSCRWWPARCCRWPASRAAARTARSRRRSSRRCAGSALAPRRSPGPGAASRRAEVLHQHITALTPACARIPGPPAFFRSSTMRLLAGIDGDERRRHAVVAPVRAVVAHGIAAAPALRS